MEFKLQKGNMNFPILMQASISFPIVMFGKYEVPIPICGNHQYIKSDFKAHNHPPVILGKHELPFKDAVEI